MNGAPRSRPAEAIQVGAATHLFLGLCTALVVGFLIWAHFGRIDIVSMANGEVIPSSQVKEVQHLEGGIVREIKVREGDRVTQGQPLVVLEPTVSSADVQELTVRMTSLRADVARLEAEATGAEAPDFPEDIRADHPDLVHEATERFRTRRSRLDNELASQRQEITQRHQEIQEVSARLRNSRNSLNLLREQIAISEELLKDDLTNRMLHIDLLRDAANLQSRIDEDMAALPRAQAAQSAAESKLGAIRDAFDEQARKELDDKRRSLEELTERLRKFEDSFNRTVLRSPVDGVVRSLYVFTVGGVVRPGDTVADVVPGEDRLVIEAKLPVQDVGYVHPGQMATVKLASADANRFGNLTGEVVHVSPDALETADGIPYYRVRIETGQDYFERRSLRYRLVPGVQVFTSIHTGDRSVLEYLADPFMGSMGTALRER